MIKLVTVWLKVQVRGKAWFTAVFIVAFTIIRILFRFVTVFFFFFNYPNYLEFCIYFYNPIFNFVQIENLINEYPTRWRIIKVFFFTLQVC